uniref:(northern house mosquito) hypothetical protein n=1 Tax=Culex pipiens TaxID=7175 RepID=A0A8D8FG23_CULPI
MELDGPRTAVDSESTQTPDAPNRPRRGLFRCRWVRRRRAGSVHVHRRGGSVVPGEEGLLDLLRQRKARTAHPAVQVHRGRQLGAPRVPAAVARGKLRHLGHGAQVQGVRVAVRDRAVQSPRLGEGLHDPALGQDDHHRDADVHHGRRRLGHHPAERGLFCARPGGRLRHHHRVHPVQDARRKHGDGDRAGQGQLDQHCDVGVGSALGCRWQRGARKAQHDLSGRGVQVSERANEC